MTTPLIAYTPTTSTYTDNRMMVYNNLSTAAWRAGLFIDKVISNRAGLASWLEA